VPVYGLKALEEPQECGIAVDQLYEVGAVVHRDGVRLQLVEDLLEASEWRAVVLVRKDSRRVSASVQWRCQ